MATIEVLVPTAEPKVKKILVNPHVQDLNGKVIGFLWNEKPNGNFLLERLRELLQQKYKLAGTEWAQVAGFHVGLKETSEGKNLASSADIVIIAICD
jgi:hypothetical protein